MRAPDGRPRVRAPRPFRRLARWAQTSTQNVLEVMRLGRIEAPAMNAPYEIVDRDRMHRLRRYARPDGARGPAAPLVLVPPLMLTAEVYDMAPDVSCVIPLAAAGVDTWVVDFGAPETEQGGMERTLDDHVRTVAKAVQTVRRITGQDVHLGGYSQGGMFAYQAAAYLRSEGLASVLAFGSPVDVHRNLPIPDDGATAAIIRTAKAGLDPVLRKIEGLPGVLTSTGFKLLTPRKEVEQLIDMVRKLHDRQELEKRATRRRFLGGEGFVAWPGPALRTLIEDFVVHNRMVSGGFVIEGRTVTLADITVPILAFVGLRDDIARPASVRAIRRAAPLAEVHTIDVEAGHFGLVIGSRALREVWPSVVEWLRWREGMGPIPALLREPEAKMPDIPDDPEEGSDDWDFSVNLDHELMLETLAGAVTSAGKRFFEAIGDASDSANALRYQLPRLRRLERIRPDTRVSLGAELARGAHEAPETTFFLWQGRAFSVAQANTRVDNVVRGLFACGVAADDRVAVVMNGRPSMLSMVTALNRMRAVAVVVPVDARDESIRDAIAKSGARFVVTDPDNAARVRGLCDVSVLSLGGGPDRARLPEGVRDMEDIDVATTTLPEGYEPDAGTARDLAMVLLTKGPFGELRPSPITNHRWAFSALGAAAACTLSERDTVYACLPLHHPAGLLVAVSSALVSGARLALGSPFSPDGFWTEVRRYGATVVFYAGEMARGLVATPPTAFDRSHPLRLFAGSGMRADLARDIADRFGVGILEFYASTSHNVVFANASGEKPGAVGRPLPGTAEVRLVRYDFEARSVVRGENGRVQETVVDEPGAALVRLDAGHEMLSGWGDRGPTRKDDPRVVENAFVTGDRWYLLADVLMRDADGDHFLVDSRGAAIATIDGPVFPRAIEDALYRLPDVERAVVQRVGPAIVASVTARKPIDAAALTAVLGELPAPSRPAFVRQVASLVMSAGFRVLPPPLGTADLSVTEGVTLFARDQDGYRKLTA